MIRYTILCLAIVLAGNAAQAFDPEKCAALIELSKKREERLDKESKLFKERRRQAERWLLLGIAPKYCSRKYAENTDTYSRCISALVQSDPSYLPKGDFKEVAAGNSGFYSDPQLERFHDQGNLEFVNILDKFKSSMKKIKQAYSREGCP
jgi:hypothetical protein